MKTHHRKIAGFAGLVALVLLVGALMPGSISFNGKNAVADEPPGFDWEITRNDFVRPCQDGPWFVGRTLRFDGSVNNGSSEHIVINSGAFHSNTAGCSATTDHGASGFSISGRTDYPAGSSGTFSFAFNANAHECGRVQLDAYFATASGTRVSDIFGIVLNYGVDCGSEPTPTPTPPTPTPTPTVATPPPTHTPSATPGPVPQAGVLSAQCVGWPTPRVVLNWTSGVNANLNSIEKGDSYPNDPDRFWEIIFHDPSLQVRTFTDTNVTPGVTYSYRVKYGPNVPSNVVTVAIDGPHCGATPTPLPPTPTTVCPVTPLSNPIASNITANSAVLSWTPGTGGTFQQLRVGSNQAEINTGCQSIPTSCAVVEHNLPSSTNSYTIQNRLNPGTTYYWRVVNLYQGPPLCYKDVAAQFTTPGTPTPTPTVTVPPGNTNLNISKLVRNITKNSGEAEVVNANPNDTIEFSIRVTNVGSGTAVNVRVSDVLPGGMRYIPGSVTIDNGQTPGTADPISGISLGNLSPGASVTVRFRAQIDPETSFIVGTTSLTNIAFANANNAPLVSDTAVVSVIRTGPVIIPGNPQLSIQKFGRNVVRGESAEFSSVTIRANDTIEFIIRVRNVASVTTNNVIITDVLPAGLMYIPTTTSVNGNLVQDGITTAGGIHIGSLLPDQEAVIRFSARVSNISAFPDGSQTAFNVVSARADNTPTVSAQLPLSFGAILQRVAGVKTGAASSVFAALLLSGILTGGYARYTRSPLFLRRNADSALKRSLKDRSKFNFARFM